eukprot:8984746-Alexandrium_andersonii.AAC.1
MRSRSSRLGPCVEDFRNLAKGRSRHPAGAAQFAAGSEADRSTAPRAPESAPLAGASPPKPEP